MLLNAFVRRGTNIIIFTLYILLRIAVNSLIWMWVNVHVTVINRKLLRVRSRFENRPHRRPRLTEWENAVLTAGKRRRRLALARAPHYYYLVFFGGCGWASKAVRVVLFILRCTPSFLLTTKARFPPLVFGVVSRRWRGYFSTLRSLVIERSTILSDTEIFGMLCLSFTWK